MSFTSEYFIINNIKSSDIGVNGAFLVRPNSAEINRNIIGDRNIIEESIPYRNEKTFYTTKSNNIELTLYISLLEDKFTNDIEFELGLIFAKNKYVSFESVDKPNIVYYVIAKSIKEITFGSYSGWWEIQMYTSAPYAHSLPEVSTFDFSGLTTTQTFEINAKFNVMHPLYNEYLFFPKLNIDLKGVTTAFEIANLSNGNRKFGMTGLTALETLEIDNDLKKITSSTGLPRVNKLTNNHNWLNLIYGKNRLTINAPCIIQFICEYPVYI